MDIVERLRAAETCSEAGQRCRSMEARSGCCCATAADEIERLRAALMIARVHVAATHGAEHMMDGFGPTQSRPSDDDLATVDAALGYEQSLRRE